MWFWHDSATKIIISMTICGIILHELIAGILHTGSLSWPTWTLNGAKPLDTPVHLHKCMCHERPFLQYWLIRRAIFSANIKDKANAWIIAFH